MLELCQWLYELPLSHSVRESPWGFPALEAAHIYCMVLLVTLIAAVDVRLLGAKLDPQPIESHYQHARRLMKWAWLAFGMNALTGTLLFTGKAPEYYLNPAFRVKMLLIFTGLVYHWFFLPVAARWKDSHAVPMASRLAGGFSLVLWIGVIAASRWIAYVAV